MTLIADVFPKLRTLKNLVRLMSKKSGLRRSFEKQHSKGAQTLLKFERQHLYHIYWSIWKQLIYKKSLLVISKILRLFSNTFSADGKYSLLDTDILSQPIQMQLSPKRKSLSSFSCEFLKSSLNFEFLEKKMTLIADVFPKLRTKKKVLRWMSKKSHFTGSLKKPHGKRDQTLLKFEPQHLYHIYWSMWRQLTYKKALLVICKILRVFSNTLIVDGKYSLLNTDNLTKAIQMQLSQRQKTFSQFFSHFWNLV